MSEPKHHHYVPRFHLSRFTDKNDKIWVYDKQNDHTFSTTPSKIAGQNQFYRLDELVKDNLNPLELENQLADLEYQVSNITNDWFRQFQKSERLIIPDINRDLISLFITTQLLRTVEARKQLVQFIKLVENRKVDKEEARSLQAALLWDDKLVNDMKKRISDCIWIFGYNESNCSFYTSDHPVTIKTLDNKQWVLGPRLFDDGMYVVFPLTPKLVMYCKEPIHWDFIKPFENSISPVKFNSDMVNHENSGQIGMSNRFIFSPMNDFEFAKEFLNENIGFKNADRERF